MANSEESFDDFAFSGPLSLKQIRKILSMEKSPGQIGKRATIEVSQPSRTIYSDSPAIDYLIRMKLAETEEMDLNSSFIEKYLKNIPTSRGDLDVVGTSVKQEPSDFIEQLTEVLHLNGSKSEQDSLIVISDEEESIDDFNTNKNSIRNNSIIYIDDEEEIKTSNNASGLTNEDHKHDIHTKQEDEKVMFDDTLEEIQMALKYGLDYLMPGESDIEKSIKTDLSPEICKHNQIDLNMDSYTQPLKVNNENCQKSSLRMEFKKPVYKIPTTSKTPNFKNVVSPVAVYIKSMRCPIMQNVKDTNAKTLFVQQHHTNTKTNKENMLPEIIYKPPRRVIKTTQPAQKLPVNIKKILPTPAVVIKHQGRLLKKNESGINEKLSSDLSIQANSSQLDSSVPLNEISVHCKKETYIV